MHYSTLKNLNNNISLPYCLAEGFTEVLPAQQLDPLIAQCKQVQDEYGMLNDAHTAAERARQFLQAAQDNGTPVHAKAVEAYAHEQSRLAETQLNVWRIPLAPLLEDFGS